MYPAKHSGPPYFLPANSLRVPEVTFHKEKRLCSPLSLRPEYIIQGPSSLSSCMQTHNCTAAWYNSTPSPQPRQSTPLATPAFHCAQWCVSPVRYHREHLQSHPASSTPHLPWPTAKDNPQLCTEDLLILQPAAAGIHTRSSEAPSPPLLYFCIDCSFTCHSLPHLSRAHSESGPAGWGSGW